jgi:predicted transcriptional regulator
MSGGNGNTDDYVEVDLFLPDELAGKVEAIARLEGRSPEDVIAAAVRVFLRRLSHRDKGSRWSPWLTR